MPKGGNFNLPPFISTIEVGVISTYPPSPHYTILVLIELLPFPSMTSTPVSL